VFERPEEEEPETARDETAEPSGEEDPANEQEILEATEEAESEDPEASVERQRDEYLALAQRTQADVENFRKRAARETAAAGERARGTLVRELLPVLDNLERALDAANPEEDHLADGVRLVRDELVAVLARAGVESYSPAGEAFDPDWHEAMLTRPGEAGQVLEVLEKGYRLNGQVLRPARVVVGAAGE